MIAKIVFELTVLVGIVVDLFTVFSNKIHKKLFESIDETKELEKELDELLSPRTIMIIDNVLFAIISIIMLFYYEHFVGFRLAFGIILLSFVGSLVDNAALFASDDHPIVTKKSYKALTKILSAVEIFMLVIIGYVGWIKRLEMAMKRFLNKLFEASKWLCAILLIMLLAILYSVLWPASLP